MGALAQYLPLLPVAMHHFSESPGVGWVMVMGATVWPRARM
jgi:hypothetical protein